MLKRFRIALPFAIVTAVLAPTAAFATTPPDAATQVQSAFDSVTTVVTGTAIPALFVLAIAVTIAMVGLRWIKKSRSAG